MKTYCFSGPIRSAKTTRLAVWAASQPHAAGLLMPDAPEGRLFRDVATGVEWPTAASVEDDNPLAIGRFSFSRAAFAQAETTLLAAAANPATRWLLVDEVGPLELRGAGLAPALRQVLETAPAAGFDVVLVVREGLRAAVAEAFDISEFLVFDFPASAAPRAATRAA